jgi:hypothetical protein
MIAHELYRLHQAVEKLKDQIQKAPLDQRPALEEKLRKTVAERDRIRNALDGQKADAKIRRR